MSHAHGNLLGEPDPTLLPANPEADRELAEGTPAAEVAARHPTVSAAWAALAEEALSRTERLLPDTIEAYAYARTGYHRGLDALRRAGWRGQGPIPASHAQNRGFLRALALLGETSRRIGDEEEAERVRSFLQEADPTLLG